ncbi:MAG: class I SAM-dependent methyltransferase [Acidimicrobiales bacterium]
MQSDVKSSLAPVTQPAPPHPVSIERPTPSPGGAAAGALAPLFDQLFPRGLPVRIELWDGSSLGPSDGKATLLVRSPDAVRRIMWAPGELGLARAFVMGDLQFEGDIHEVLELLHRAARPDIRTGVRFPLLALAAARRLGALGPPLPAPPEEASPHGRLHSRQRDAQVVSHHYDVSNAFYRMVLGPTMTYSCARFTTDTSTLDEAQEAKLDLVCRKLGLHERPGQRVLDVGCGWGSLALHAARHYGAQVVGVTLSGEQAELARARVADAGLEAQIAIRQQDYRDIREKPFDAVASIGMFEHVGAAKMAAYFATLRGLLTPMGRLLNHAISSVGGSRIARSSFIGRYVFPDGELMDVGTVVLAMEQAGFEVRDVESLREHYAKTLRAWVHNLQDNWDHAVAEVGVRRARVWQLYMAASANGFDDGGISIHQVLGVVPDPEGRSGLPLTRASWA